MNISTIHKKTFKLETIHKKTFKLENLTTVTVPAPNVTKHVKQVLVSKESFYFKFLSCSWKVDSFKPFLCANQRCNIGDQPTEIFYSYAKASKAFQIQAWHF
jgi:hypothetical protein